MCTYELFDLMLSANSMVIVKPNGFHMAVVIEVELFGDHCCCCFVVVVMRPIIVSVQIVIGVYRSFFVVSFFFGTNMR